jgi:hypothetical protein
MFKNRSNQAGFGVAEVIIAVAVVVLLGSTGYLIYKSHHKQSTPRSTTGANTGSKTTGTGNSSTPPPTTAYFTIQEWGVQAPYSGSDLTYSPESGNSSVELLSSKQLAAASTSCTAGDAGYIGRYLPTDTLPGPAQQTAQQYFNQDFPADAKPDYAKISNYYYLYVAPQDNCSTDTTAMTQATNAARNIVDNLQAATN